MDEIQSSFLFRFYVLPPHFLVVQIDYDARELFKDVKQARQLTQIGIKQAQKGKKYQYDKTAKETSIKEGDIVMLKVEPKDLNWTGLTKGLTELKR